MSIQVSTQQSPISLETVNHCQTLDELLNLLPHNDIIINNAIKAWWKINDNKYDSIIATISGGADSDVMLDILYRCDKDNKITYVWFDTGIEYQATKDHLQYLEKKYNIVFERKRAKRTVPLSCKKNGQPFMSKYSSDMISRLQKHNFDFCKDGNLQYEELIKKYDNCIGALKWWCNYYEGNSSFNIKRNKWLKEFMIINKPTFNISSKCCNDAKKKLIHDELKDNNYDLTCLGVRKSEGGIRATSYKNCFDYNDDGADNYRPLFFYSDNDKKIYEDKMNILHSECYTLYGLKRTGCVGCPFGKDFEFELSVAEKYEQKLYKAVCNIFKDSYEYTRRYKEFCKEMDLKYGSYAKYLRENK